MDVKIGQEVKVTIDAISDTEKEVETGIYDEDNIEIVSGLEEGQSVILPQLVKGTSSTSNENKGNNSFGGFGGMPNGGGMPGM